MTTNAGKFFILDTNILLHDPLAFLNFDEHNVVIPMVVLEELDNIKDRNRDVSREAWVAIRSLEEVLKEATPEEIVAGVPLNRVQGEHTANGTLAIFPDYQLEQTESVLSLAENDHRIIQAALEIQRERSPAGVVLVTKDINMRLKAKGAGMKYVEDYRTDQLIDDIRLLTKGFYKFEGDFWSQVGEVQTQQEGRDAYHTVSRELLPQVFANEYIIDSTNNFAARVEEYDSETVTLMDLSVERMMSYGAWGVHPKNIYQAMAMHALLDTSMDMVTLTGPAGSGKTGIRSTLFIIFVQTSLENINELRKQNVRSDAKDFIKRRNSANEGLIWISSKSDVTREAA